jgi:hypothetical protein
MCVAWLIEIERRPSEVHSQGASDGPTPPYPKARPNGRSAYHPISAWWTTSMPGSIPRANDTPPSSASRILRSITLALFQQLRGTESQRSFLRDAERFFSHLFPGVVGLSPSSFHRRLHKLGRYLEPLRREVLAELTGEPETLIVDSTLLSVLHPTGRSPSPQASLVRPG